MHLLFEKSHPNDLVDALKLIHQTDDLNRFTLMYFNKYVDDITLNLPVVFVFDNTPKGLAITTEKLYEEGFRVFALKTKKTDKLDFFKLSLTVLQIWPQIIDIAESNRLPFIYTYKYCGKKLFKVRA
jgi:hypothetical protein